MKWTTLKRIKKLDLLYLDYSKEEARKILEKNMVGNIMEDIIWKID